MPLFEALVVDRIVLSSLDFSDLNIHNLLDYLSWRKGHLRSSRRITRAATRSVKISPLAVGELVKIDTGPLQGREGIVVEDRSPRIVLMVHLATRAAPVEMDRNCIRAIGIPPQPADSL